MAVDRKAYDIVIKVCDFNKRAIVEKKYIDKPSVEKLINSEKFKEDMKFGRKLGLLTHEARYDEKDFSKNIPYCDNILLNKDVCNVTRDMQIEGDSIVAGIDLLDTDAGNMIKSMLAKKVPVGVSMACRTPLNLAGDKDRFYLSEILGVDFTMSPDLDVELLAVNFSANEKPESDDDVEVMNVFSTKTLSDDRVLSTNFSLQDNVREAQQAPYMILRNRINEVIRLCQSKKQEFIDKNIATIKEYIQGYVLNWITTQLNSGNSDINVALSLRLSNYLSDAKASRELQKSFRKLKSQMATTGAMDKYLQKELNQNYRKVMTGVFEYINKQLEKAGKHLEV